ncbi:hypothetical protein, partial [Rhodanobacter sp. MP7CTX1]|uniref:hypothetical protein n=1 Tax=Rhodanobacter sp. MP7CTX1 TaxID=2723084 RepID=UPI001621440F
MLRLNKIELRALSSPSTPLTTVDTRSTSHPREASGSAGALRKCRVRLLASTLALMLPLAAGAVTMAPHPRLILDTNTLTTLRQSAANNSAQWQTLKAT